MPFLLSSIGAPIGIIGITVLLCFRLGWTGLFALLIIILLTPVQLIIGKLNGFLLKQANIDKDYRIKLTSEIMEGIKFIKMYGWELVFKKIVQGIRNKENYGYIKLGIGRGI